MHNKHRNPQDPEFRGQLLKTLKFPSSFSPPCPSRNVLFSSSSSRSVLFRSSSPRSVHFSSSSPRSKSVLLKTQSSPAETQQLLKIKIQELIV